MAERREWATPTLKEVPFWREDMSPEEYERERTYMIQNWDSVLQGRYIPLWKQAETDRREPAVFCA